MLNPEPLPLDPTERLERRIRAWGLILWPSFLAACLLEMMVFSIVDPAELHWPGHAGAASTRAIYTVAFFAFWLVCALCSRLVIWLDRSHRPRTPMQLSCTPADGPGV
jgi:hypothetical protein